MKKDFGVKTWLYLMLVLIIAPIASEPVSHVYRPLVDALVQVLKVGLELV